MAHIVAGMSSLIQYLAEIKIDLKPRKSIRPYMQNPYLFAALNSLKLVNDLDDIFTQ